MERTAWPIRIAIRWGPAIIMMGLIFLASGLPSSTLPQFPGLAEWLIKKGGHFLAYLILGRLLWRGYGYQAEFRTRAWIFAALYAVSDELHQAFVPGRNPTLMDVGIDWAGAALAIWGPRWFLPEDSR